MSPQGNHTGSGSRGNGVLGGTSGMRAWTDGHPAGAAVVQALVFGLVFGTLMALSDTHRSLASDVVRAAIAAVILGLLMWGLMVLRRRRSGRG